MNSRSFDFRFWIILAGLGAVLALVVLVGSQFGLSAPRMVPEDGVVGAYGPVTLAFSESMDTESVDSTLSAVRIG